MRSKINAGTGIVLVSAFLFYFISEALLREGVISQASKEAVDVDSLLKLLPEEAREAVKYNIRIGYLRDSLVNAAEGPEKAAALCALAQAMEKDKEKQTKLFQEAAREYPDKKESVQAYVFLLFHPEKNIAIPVKKFYDYVLQFDQKDQYYIWNLALTGMKKKRKTKEQLLEFMLPLLEQEPKYKNYARLYKEMTLLAAKLGETDTYTKARDREEKALDCPSIESLEKKEYQKRQKKKHTNGKKAK